MIRGSISDSDRFGAFMTIQVVQLNLFEVLSTVDGVPVCIKQKGVNQVA